MQRSRPAVKIPHIFIITHIEAVPAQMKINHIFNTISKSDANGVCHTPRYLVLAGKSITLYRLEVAGSWVRAKMPMQVRFVRTKIHDRMIPVCTLQALFPGRPDYARACNLLSKRKVAVPQYRLQILFPSSSVHLLAMWLLISRRDVSPMDYSGHGERYVFQPPSDTDLAYERME